MSKLLSWAKDPYNGSLSNFPFSSTIKSPCVMLCRMIHGISNLSWSFTFLGIKPMLFCYLEWEPLYLLLSPTCFHNSSFFQWVLKTSEHRTLSAPVDWRTHFQFSHGYLCHFCLVTQHIMLFGWILFKLLSGCEVKGPYFMDICMFQQVQCLVRSRGSIYLWNIWNNGWVRDHASAPPLLSVS